MNTFFFPSPWLGGLGLGLGGSAFGSLGRDAQHSRLLQLGSTLARTTCAFKRCSSERRLAVQVAASRFDSPLVASLAAYRVEDSGGNCRIV